MITQIIKEIIKDTTFQLSKPREVEIQGVKMWINTKEPSFSMRKTLRYYATTKAHELATTELFKRIVKEGDFVIDIGANLGYFSLLAKKLGAFVNAFEPEPKNFAYLKKNIELNNYNIVASDYAISDVENIARLYFCSYDSGHHTLNQNEGIKNYRKTSLLRKCLDLFSREKYVKIQENRLDNLIKGRVDVIKMDIEGSEALALAGMNRILKENRDIKLIVEFFPLLLKSMGSSPRYFINKILSYGFKIYIIPHDYNGGEELLKVENFKELMRYCPDKESHLNLYLRR